MLRGPKDSLESGEGLIGVTLLEEVPLGMGFEVSEAESKF